MSWINVLNKKHTNKIIFILLIIFLLSIYFNTTLAINGASRGIYLWYSSLLPALLAPLIILNMLLSLSNSNQALIIILCSIAGIPASSKILSDMLVTGKIETKKYIFSLLLTSNPSLSFMTSYIFILINKKQAMNNSLLFYPVIVVAISSIITTILITKLSPETLNIRKNNLDKTNPAPLNTENTMDNIINSCVLTVIKILGYVVLFSTLCEILSTLGNFTIVLIIRSYLEISCGIMLILDNYNSPLLYNSLICSLCAFGGLCGILQIYCFVPYKTKEMLYFLIKYKMLNAILAFSISYVIGLLIF